MKHLRPATAVAAGLVVVTVVAGSAVSASGDEQSASAAGTSAAAAQEACQEDLVREAIDNSGGIAPDLEYEITYLKCAEGFGWATLDPTQENFDTGTALLRVADSGVEVLDVTTAPCPADLGIPDDVAAEIAPPGSDPNAACGAPVEAEPGFPVQAEPDFTG
jgi:hypothetical protein